MNRLKEKYLNEVVPSLKEKYNYKSIMEVPKLEKVVINMGVLQLACKNLGIFIRSGGDLEHSKAIAREWERLGKVSYKSRIQKQKIDSLKKAK